MAALSSASVGDRTAPDQRVLLHGIAWTAYSALRDALDAAGSRARLTYLHGELEIMSPSEDHETTKKLLARLLEAWADECGVDLEGAGSTSYRKQAAERGLEPDECYCIGSLRDVPDVAIEVVSRPLVDKLEVYRGLAVAEVCVYEEGHLTVHHLEGGAYRTQARSELLPTLDLSLLASFVQPRAKQSQAVCAYRARLRAKRDA